MGEVASVILPPRHKPPPPSPKLELKAAMLEASYFRSSDLFFQQDVEILLMLFTAALGFIPE